MKKTKFEYKIVKGVAGFADLELSVNDLLNQGWKPLGGITFNVGVPYQTMARSIVTEVNDTPTSPNRGEKEDLHQTKTQQDKELNKLGAQDAFRRLNELT